MIYHANHFSPVGYSFISCLNHFQMHSSLSLGFPCGSDGKESACNEGHLGSIPGLGTSPGEGNGNPLQYSCLENPTDGGTWWATVHGVAKSWTQLSDFHFTLLNIIHTIL